MNCLNCEIIIVKNGLQLKDGTFTWAPGESKKIEHKESRRFVRCPNCKAKNYLGDVPNDKITWLQERFVSFEFD